MSSVRVKRILAGLSRAMIAASTAALGLALVFGQHIPDWIGIVAAVFAGLMIALGLLDLKVRRVPNLVTYPLMAVGIFRAVVFQDDRLIPFWIGVIIIWTLRFIGGGDSKLLMGLFGLWPDLRLLWVISLVAIIGGVPYLAFKYARRWRSATNELTSRFASGALLPDEAEFQREAVPFAIAFSVAGVLYLYAFVLTA